MAQNEDVARRDRGEGTIYRHRQGEHVYWRVTLSLGIDPFGRRIRKYWQRKTRKEAARVLGENIRRQHAGLPFEDERVTLGEYGGRWLEDTRAHVRPSTWSFYDVLVRLHLAELALIPVNRLTAPMVRDLVRTRLREGYATRTVRGVVGVLGMILRQAMRDGIVTLNVTEGIRLPQLEQRPARPFTIEESRHFLEVIRGDWLESLFVTALGTGLRRGELVALTWADVDLEAAMLTVRHSKTERGVRTIPIPPIVVATLRARGRGIGPIWSVTDDAVSRHFRQLCQRAGLPPIRFHDLRHTTATFLLAEGIDPLVIQSILGHTSLAVTARYAHVVTESQVEAMRRLNLRLAGHMAGLPPSGGVASRLGNGDS